MKINKTILSIVIISVVIIMVVIIMRQLLSPPPSCTNFDYSDWSQCVKNGIQTRTITKALPEGCNGGDPIKLQNCKYESSTLSSCTSFDYSDWSQCSVYGKQTRTITKALPEGCNGGDPIKLQNCKYEPTLINVGPKWDYVSLTPEIFTKIIQKIKGTPNAEIKATVSEKNSSVTFYYSFVTHDPCEPLLKNFLVFEMEIITDTDENGRRYPNGPITDYYTMRDTDYDNFPEDYFTNTNSDVKLCDPLLPLTEDTPNINDLLSYWEAGMNYFAKNLLK